MTDMHRPECSFSCLFSKAESVINNNWLASGGLVETYPLPPNQQHVPFYVYIQYKYMIRDLFNVAIRAMPWSRTNVSAKRIIIEARENKGFVCTEEVWGYCTLTNEVNAGGYLYLSWYSKGNLGSVCLVAD